MTGKLTMALTKGRVLPQALSLLAKTGVEPKDDVFSSRKLVFETNDPGLDLMILRGMDVPTYVEHGIADIGMSGKDVLMEHGETGYYEPLDLKIGRCRLMVAGLAEEPALPVRMKIATKFVNAAKRYYAEKGLQVDIIKLYGAMELAPLTGLAHRIVDIVETGNTLKANGMVPMELVSEISTRLIVNKISMKMKHSAVTRVVSSLEEAVES